MSTNTETPDAARIFEVLAARLEPAIEAVGEELDRLDTENPRLLAAQLDLVHLHMDLLAVAGMV